MNEQSLAHLDTIIRSATEQLGSSVGAELTAIATVLQGEHAFAATIGFTGEAIFGALAITASPDFVASTLPEQIRHVTPDTEAMADWAGELANQLLGRIKNKLLPLSIDIAVSTPVVFIGQKIRHLTSAPKLHRDFSFSYKTATCTVVFEANCAPDLEIGDPSTVEAQSMPEGELELF